ncbi:FAD-dependent monooxygenase [Undibacterium rugosum]|nr:FAD-dependent monooxygenase [Undibacterium rugosum]MBR7779323.1 FAD-dependent monooxygenase [Undibacterium rugosum]
MLHTPVLIVGGSLVGLSASLFFAWRGVPHILVDKHAGSSPHPRAMGYTETTLEHYRMVGIANRIPQTPPEFRLRRVTVANLADEWQGEHAWTPGEADKHNSGLSPNTGAAIAQDKLEPILRNAALELGAELRLGTELLDFEDHGGEIIARLRDRNNGQEYTISADYLIATDGADSAIRERLGIVREGVGHVQTVRSVLFTCPEADQYLARGAQQFEIEQENFRAFLTTYNDSRWLLMFVDDNERSEDELRAAIRQALGRDMAFDIITTGRWEMAGRIATQYKKGRVFLAGDAAHQLPPTRGGFGANTGIDDVWNLAWKLQRVLDGISDASLLDTYDAERRPIGWLRHQQTFSRPDYAKWVNSDFKADPLFRNDAMELGQLVRSSAVIGAGSELPAAATPLEWAGQPGTRAPHVWLTNTAGERISSLDLFGLEFVLLAETSAWREAADALKLKLVCIGKDVHFLEPETFAATFGIPPHGAVLVRPDGIIAWRSNNTAQAGGANELKLALTQVAAFAC